MGHPPTPLHKGEILSASAHLETFVRKRHVHKAGTSIRRILSEDATDTGCRLRALGHHI